MLIAYHFIRIFFLSCVFFILHFQSSDSEDDFDDDEEDSKFKTTTVEKTEESTYSGVSTQGSDSQPNNCDLHFRLKTLSPTSSCVIS